MAFIDTTNRADVAEIEAWWATKLDLVEPTLKEADITAAWWSFSLASEGVVSDAADINQCLSVIANTPRNADPYRPDFASQVHDYLDWPVSEAQPFVVRELVGAIERWETRVNLEVLAISPYKPTPSSISVEATWGLAGVSESVAFAVG